MRRTPVILACLGAVLTAAGCGSGTDGDAAAKPSGSGAGSPSTSAAPAAKTADPPMSFDKSAPVGLPDGALRANAAGAVTSTFMTLRDRTGYIVTPPR